jgi:hypothetical protein
VHAFSSSSVNNLTALETGTSHLESIVKVAGGQVFDGPLCQTLGAQSLGIRRTGYGRDCSGHLRTATFHWVESV